MKNTLKFDAIAGLSVFLVAIPLCLGIALACGAPLISGLISGIIGGIVIGILSDSPLSVSGPAAGLVAIVLVGITEMGSYSSFLAALVLAGIIQILMGVFKAGKLTRLLPHCVIEGMMAAIGIILIMKQFPNLIGQNDTTSYHILIMGLGLLSLGMLVIWDSFFSHRFKLIPGSLIVVLAGIIATLVLNMTLYRGGVDAGYFVQIPSINSIEEFQAALAFPNWEMLSNPLLYKTAIVLAIVASIESLLCINAVERLDPLGRHTNKNRELVAQGIGNTLSGLVGGLPITSVIVRSSVNLNAGAKTKASAIIHGLMILFVLFLGATLMNHVPLASLSAILLFTGYKLAHPKHFLTAWKTGPIDFVAFISTALIVVVNDLLIGVIAGIAIYYILVQIKKKRTRKQDDIQAQVVDQN
jgi:MFS superfamily sulfate permease-like transporter